MIVWGLLHHLVCGACGYQYETTEESRQLHVRRRPVMKNPFKPKERSLRRRLALAVVNAATCTALFGASFVGMQAVTPLDMTFPEKGAGAEAHVSRAERMVERGQCWTGEAPAEMQGVVPGHVWADGEYRGARAVGLALEQIFEGKDHGLHVQAFCR